MSMNGGRNRADLLGQRFGKLQVVSREPSSAGGKARWFCICDCGDSTVALTNDLRSGHTSSCGTCSKTKHGQHLTPEYNTWRQLNQRCSNPKNPKYKDYGGRGIRVGFANFEQFLSEVGPRPDGHSIDRIDNSRGYEPGNVRWATPSVQNRNRRANVWVELDGKTMVATDAARILGWKPGSIHGFLKAGKDGVRVIDTPTLPADVRAALGECP